MAPDEGNSHPISIFRAYFTVTAVLLSLFIGSGSVYGYNALRPTLIRDGAYADRCPVGTLDCPEQRLALNYVETWCFFVIDIVALPCGLLVDYLGLRVVGIMLGILNGFGYVFIVAASYTKMGILYLVGLVFLAAAPSCIYLLSLGSAKMLRGNKTHWVSALTSLAYETSPMYMFFLQVLIPSYTSFAMAFAIFGAVTTALSIASSLTHLSTREILALDQLHGLTGGSKSSPRAGSSIWPHLRHSRYLTHMMFMTVVNTKNQFYVATFADQIDYFATKEEAAWVNYIFDVGFFISAPIVTPIVIVFLGRFKDRNDIVFFTLWTLTMCHAFLNTFGKTSRLCQIIAMMIFFLLKPLKWAASAEFLHRPPYELSMYGRLYGIITICCGGGALMIYPLTRMSFVLFDGSFFEANLILTLCEALVVVFPIYLYYEHRSQWKLRESLWEEATPLLENGLLAKQKMSKANGSPHHHQHEPMARHTKYVPPSPIDVQVPVLTTSNGELRKRTEQKGN